MTGSGSGGPESKGEKRLNEDLVVFMRKRSDVDAAHYVPTLKNYVTLQQKRQRAAIARQKVEHAHDKMSEKKQENDLKSKVKVPLSGENNVGENERKRRVIGDKNGGVRSRSRSEEQTDSACRRRRRRRSCRHRKRSGRRLHRSGRRRRRSCRRRRRSGRRRRRSCRRRRRSGRRRRSRSRRRRHCGKCRQRRRRRRC